VSESIFTEVLVACNKFTTLHSKFVQANLHNVSQDVLLVSFDNGTLLYMTHNFFNIVVSTLET